MSIQSDEAELRADPELARAFEENRPLFANIIAKRRGDMSPAQVARMKEAVEAAFMCGFMFRKGGWVVR